MGGLHLGRVGQTPPPKIHGLLWDTVNKREVHILLECFLVTNNIKKHSNGLWQY